MSMQLTGMHMHSQLPVQQMYGRMHRQPPLQRAGSNIQSLVPSCFVTSQRFSEETVAYLAFEHLQHQEEQETQADTDSE